MIELKTGMDDAGRRLDRILRKALPDYSLSLIHRLLRQGKVLIDGNRAAGDERLREGSVIQILLQTRRVNHGVDKVNAMVNERVNAVNAINNHTVNHINEKVNGTSLLPEILWRGSGIIVFNKPAGLATHGRASLDTLVNAYLAGKLPASLSFKPGPLHRLDRPTSGIIAFSETLAGARLFSRLLRERKLEKTYLAIVEGRITQDETWQDDLVRDRTIKKTFANTGRREKTQNAVTMVRGIASNDAYSLIEARIVTGRTHQIRSQAAFHGRPLAGDVKYGGHANADAVGIGDGIFLHAWKIKLTENSDDFPDLFVAPVPQAFMSRIHSLFGKINRLL